MGASGLLARGPPPSPAWVTYIKYAILGLSVVCLAMGAWATSIFGGASGVILSAGAGGLVIFVTIFTFIVYGGGLALEKFQPNNYFRIGLLIGYIFSVIFWLSGWAWSASLAGLWLSYTDTYRGFGIEDDYYAPIRNLGAALAVCAGLGAVVWVLCIVNLVMFIKACIQDPNSNNAELGNIKHQPAAYPAAQYPAQYPAQPQAYPQQPAGPYGQSQPYATQ